LVSFWLLKEIIIMANHNLPTLSSTYADFVSHLDARLDDILVGVDLTSTGLPNGTIRWDGTTWKKYVLSTNSWTDLASSYSININGTVGANTPTTLSTTGVASLGANSTVGTVPIVSTTGTQTLTNKTLTSPVISSISNSGTITLPTTTTTLVGRDTTDTLSNKTLSRPKFADGGSIDDADGNKLIEFDSVASAINYLKVANAPTGSPGVVTLTAAGGNTNISLNLVPTGTGSITINGVPAVTTTGTQTLTNKTLGTGTVYNGGTIGHDYGGTGTTTAPVAGAVVYGVSTTAQGYTEAGTAGQLLKSNGTGAPTWVDASTLTVSHAATAGSATTATSAGTAGSAVVANNAATVTNGVYTIGDQIIGGQKLFSSSLFVQLPVAVDSEIQFGFTRLSGTGTAYFYHKNNTDKTLGLYDSATGTRWFTDSANNLVVSGNVTAFSDERVKTDWKPLHSTFISDLANIKSGSYLRKDTDIRQVGVGAQSLQQVLPEAVLADDEGMLSVNYGAAAMVSAVELAKLVLQLQREIEQLKQKLA
jgi:hypothetical protein